MSAAQHHPASAKTVRAHFRRKILLGTQTHELRNRCLDLDRLSYLGVGTPAPIKIQKDKSNNYLIFGLPIEGFVKKTLSKCDWVNVVFSSISFLGNLLNKALAGGRLKNNFVKL